MAGSKSHGQFVAANMNTGFSSLSFPKPEMKYTDIIDMYWFKTWPMHLATLYLLLHILKKMYLLLHISLSQLFWQAVLWPSPAINKHYNFDKGNILNFLCFCIHNLSSMHPSQSSEDFHEQTHLIRNGTKYVSPSNSCSIWVFNARLSSLSPDSLVDIRASTSSMNRTHGALFLAWKWKISTTWHKI